MHRQIKRNWDSVWWGGWQEQRGEQMETSWKQSTQGVCDLHLEYGMAASCTSADFHFGRLHRVQNQATRLITGGMKSTPIQSLEEATGIQPLADRRDHLRHSVTRSHTTDTKTKQNIEQSQHWAMHRSHFIWSHLACIYIQLVFNLVCKNQTI